MFIASSVIFPNTPRQGRDSITGTMLAGKAENSYFLQRSLVVAITTCVPEILLTGRPSKESWGHGRVKKVEKYTALYWKSFPSFILLLHQAFLHKFGSTTVHQNAETSRWNLKFSKWFPIAFITARRSVFWVRCQANSHFALGSSLENPCLVQKTDRLAVKKS